MLSRSGRPLAQAIFGPIARLCVRAGISADAVTITGTVAVVACALILYPLGHPVWASWIIGITVIFDSLDGQIARLTGTASRWGAFLDSTLDRLADSAIFCGILLWIVRWNIGAGAGLPVDGHHALGYRDPPGYREVGQGHQQYPGARPVAGDQRPEEHNNQPISAFADPHIRGESHRFGAGARVGGAQR
ncbi:CDP-alcohol phosphatidyltransferase family protein, partial [Actinotignum timonense]|nr:CDP-alcohol phosphatidyltransferase family protein [Actinotignum timonense]